LSLTAHELERFDLAETLHAECLTGVVRRAILWLQVTSKLPVDRDADDMVARRLAEATGGLKSRPAARRGYTCRFWSPLALSTPSP
jgi:hypothetical protein